MTRQLLCDSRDRFWGARSDLTQRMMPAESIETISLAQLEKYSIFTAFWGEQQAAAAIVAAVCILTRCRA